MEACFPCLGVRKTRVPPRGAQPHTATTVEGTSGDPHRRNVSDAARTFSFEELAVATRSFRDDRLVAGREPFLYKGHLKSVNQVVAMKLQHLPHPHGSSEQGNSEFLARVLMLNALRHPNLVNLIGFCADGNHRILVHEHMPLGSLEDHLHDPSPDKARLDWNTRMNIAAGVARGLEYLHEKGVLCRCLRSSHVLLGNVDGYYPKLSQYGLAKVGQHLDDAGEARDFLTDTAGNLAPETAMTGKLSVASDVYSFGVVLLELITGRRPCSPHAAAVEDRTLVAWARSLLENRAEFRRMADPALQGRYPPMDLEEALAVASRCIQQDPRMRSPIGAVVAALGRLAYDRSS